MTKASETALRISEQALSKACPICGKPGLARYRPFCSKRCSDIDLNRWLGGVYAIPEKEGDTLSASDSKSAE